MVEPSQESRFVVAAASDLDNHESFTDADFAAQIAAGERTAAELLEHAKHLQLLIDCRPGKIVDKLQEFRMVIKIALYFKLPQNRLLDRVAKAAEALVILMDRKCGRFFSPRFVVFEN